jgi:hypothetical protein
MEVSRTPDFILNRKVRVLSKGSLQFLKHNDELGTEADCLPDMHKALGSIYGTKKKTKKVSRGFVFAFLFLCGHCFILISLQLTMFMRLNTRSSVKLQRSVKLM